MDHTTVTAGAPHPVSSASGRLPYAALVSLMVMSFLLITAEFLPNGVLLEIAADLDVTPGRAGQMVTVTAVAGLVVAPTVGLVLPRLDRRRLLVWTTLAAGVSSVLVAVLPTLAGVLVARVLLGAAISTFWAMSITVAAHLVGSERIGRAMMFVTAGLSLATVAGVPLGVLLSDLGGWRPVFLVTGLASLALAVPLRLLLPPVPAAAASSPRLLLQTLRRPGVGTGIAGNVLVVLGHFLAYTYIRLAVDRVDGAGATTAVLLLLVFGAGGLVGNLVVGSVIDRTFVALSVLAPVTMAVAVAVVIALPQSLGAVGVAILVWGFFFASWLIIVNTWIGHRLSDRLEAGGGLSVTGFQLAIVLAAGLGGVLVDVEGVATGYLVAVALLVVGAAAFGAANRRR